MQKKDTPGNAGKFENNSGNGTGKTEISRGFSGRGNSRCQP